MMFTCVGLKDYEIQDIVNELLFKKQCKKKCNYLLKGSRGKECGYDECNLTHNVFYRNIKNNLYYCRRCALIINYLTNRKLCVYEEPTFFNKI